MTMTINTLEYLKSICPTVSVGLMSADFLNLGHAISSLEKAGVKLLHLDVMDGNFCPSLTMGPPVIKQLKTSMLLDTHLMIENPMESLAQYIDAGCRLLTIPCESSVHNHRTLQLIKELKPDIIRGIALNPGTDISAVEPLLDELEMVVILAVNPGWSGQKFIQAVKSKFKNLKSLIKNRKKEILTVIDGGITLENINEISLLKPDIVISGSAIFKGNEITGNMKLMTDALRKRI
ncbi:MAG TPA: ribulose-phosphate 3-epimerase [Bacteroidales bacterium]|nr:ribulose-phosphate 3-epimerase [Bacteroidales bacterium]